jgi:8-hydroxy-5-deazaflavin:NADPH oxidoreductase
VILTIPLHKYRTLVPSQLAGKIVIDAMNYWAPTEGTLAEFEDAKSSSQVIQRFLPDARLVRTLNHIGYHELEEDGRPPGHPQRRSLALAGDDAAAKATVAEFIDRLGYDPVDAGRLDAARAFDVGTRIFNESFRRAEMEQQLRTFADQDQHAE